MYSESKVGTPQPTRKNSVSGGFFWISGKCIVFDCETRFTLTPIWPQHADRRLADALVVDVAVVRAVQRDLEAVSDSRRRPAVAFALLTSRRRRRVEFRRPAVDERRHDHAGRHRLAAHDDALDRRRGSAPCSWPGARCLSANGFLPSTLSPFRSVDADVHAEEDRAVLGPDVDAQVLRGSSAARCPAPARPARSRPRPTAAPRRRVASALIGM